MPGAAKRRRVEGAGVDGCFRGCYLLSPAAVRTSVRTYIGYTVDPLRRLRQHNGEIKGGARKTASGRPWHMELVVHGFPNNITALRFEWAWQNPRRSTRLRHVSPTRKGVAGKLAVLAEMLHCPTWARLPLTVHFVSREAGRAFEALGRSPPPHVLLRYGEISPAIVRCADPACRCGDSDATAWRVDLAELLESEGGGGAGGAGDASESETGSESESDAEGGRRSPTFEVVDVDDSDDDDDDDKGGGNSAAAASGRDAVEKADGDVGLAARLAQASPAAAGVPSGECAVCGEVIAPGQPWVGCRKPPCRNMVAAGVATSAEATAWCAMEAHVRCFAEYLLSEEGDDGRCLPVQGACPVCDRALRWGDLIAAAAKRAG